MSEHTVGAVPHTYYEVGHNGAGIVQGGVIEESIVSIYVNGQELATMMCSPLDQEALALGFLYNEGVIQSMDDVGLVQMNVSGGVVDVLLKRQTFRPPRRMILTSGCGGGVTLQHLTDSYPGVQSEFATTPDVIFERMRDLRGEARLYQFVRGVHTAVLADTEGVLVSAEDVGRHNAVDKIMGKALQAGIEPRDRIILTSGRISSEMLGKARRMGVPLVASRTAPTSMTVRLAQAWNICVVGYVRQGSLRVYTCPERMALPVPSGPVATSVCSERES
jgi:FdhD protein